ncbi:MAG TPA: cytochrome c oxidase subunit II [Caulobacteraceae bacterium]|jgi:cytochrome c oxidase subunit 2
MNGLPPDMPANPLPFWPPAASAYAHALDRLVVSFSALIIALALPVFVLIFVFAIRYRRGRKVNRTAKERGDLWIEIGWSVIPFVLTLYFFVQASVLYAQQTRPPANALRIDVVGKQWMWKFQHPEGQGEIDDLHVPAGEPVMLNMASQDVIHSFYVPALRLKRDVVPGRYTRMWFIADQPGVYPIECSQFCGMNHPRMRGSLHVMSAADYGRWLQVSQVEQTLADQGAATYRKAGCSGCHDHGAVMRAPSLAGLAGQTVPLEGGQTVVADAQYLRDSILQPGREVVAGYPALMPSYQGSLDEGQVQTLVAYLQSLATKTPEVPR